MSQLKQITQRQERLLEKFKFGQKYPISEIGEFSAVDMDSKISLATLKRDLNSLIELNFLNIEGEKRGSVYTLSNFGLIHRSLKVEDYFINLDLRENIITTYNFDLFQILENTQIFTEKEMETLNKNTEIFKNKGTGSSDVIVKKELERFVIELSWKSSKIEGNTYTLLDTEKLLREGVVSSSNTKDETTMILNHKKTFSYILESVKMEKSLENFRELENIHRLLVESLGINHGLRKNAVGVTGTKYLPLGMGPQIEAEVKRFIELIKNKKDFYSKALLAILCISYLQAFEDGNKRTGRLFANAMLLAGGLAPLSYRDVDEKRYREAVLIFYEQNSLEAFKQIFVEQYIFSCNTYNLG